MTKILFVCHGNICRSPAAKIVFNHLAEKAGLEDELIADSAATTTEEIGNPVYPPMARVLRDRGYDCSGHEARLVRRSDYALYDRIIGMDDENLWDLRRIFQGDPEGKLSYLASFSGNDDHSISDPWYTRNFSACLDEIEDGCAGLFEELTGIVFLDFFAASDVSELYAEMRHKMAWESWYGENLDALRDILTGLPHRGRRFILIPPSEEAPPEVRMVADKIASIFEAQEEGRLL